MFHFAKYEWIYTLYEFIRLKYNKIRIVTKSIKTKYVKIGLLADD